MGQVGHFLTEQVGHFEGVLSNLPHSMKENVILIFFRVFFIFCINLSSLQVSLNRNEDLQEKNQKWDHFS